MEFVAVEEAGRFQPPHFATGAVRLHGPRRHLTRWPRPGGLYASWEMSLLLSGRSTAKASCSTWTKRTRPMSSIPVPVTQSRASIRVSWGFARLVQQHCMGVLPPNRCMFHYARLSPPYRHHDCGPNSTISGGAVLVPGLYISMWKEPRDHVWKTDVLCEASLWPQQQVKSVRRILCQ